MKKLICIVCPRGCHLRVDERDGCRVTGNSCPRGTAYGKTELTNPIRVVTSTIRIEGAAYPRFPVKTSEPIPKEKIFDAMKALGTVVFRSPVRIGQAVVKNICGTGVDFIATRNL